MATTKKAVKHAKIKNTGILFEVLARQLTADIINGEKKSKAQELIEKNFRSDTELGKEHRLYQALVKHKMDDSEKANLLVNEVIESHKKLNKSELRKMKYNLVHEIKENWPVDSLFKARIDNYKVLASIYKLFQAKSDNMDYTPEDVVESRYTIIEHIIGKKEQLTESVEENGLKKMLSEYEQQNKDLRILTYKILVDRFNEKYSGLNEQQKSLIREYINNVSSVNSLETYVANEIPIIVKELTTLTQKVDDKVTRIKVNEILNQLDLLKEAKSIGDNQVTALLNIYELIKELKSLEKSNEK
jgi:hypothetical protein